MKKGILIPIGGNEDKGQEISENYTLDFIESGILSNVVRESGGRLSKIVIVPTASNIQREVGDNYIQAFDKLGCKNVKVLAINSVREAEDSGNIRDLEEAACVMFSGGDQSKIVQHIGNTKFHHILQERYELEHFVIAGTSAGAMAMSLDMIASGNITESLLRGTVKFKQGMGFVPELIIDSHFIKRGRFGRLTEAVAAFPQLIGVGLSEDTGIIIKNEHFTVIGSGMVIIFDSSKSTHNNRSILDDDLPLSLTDLTVHVLAKGDEYDIKAKKPSVITLEAYNRL